MKISAPGIEVNGIRITPEEINAEVQYHPAESLFSAKYEAMRALVVREILIQRASELGLCRRDEGIRDPDAVIDRLLEEEIKIPEADEGTCRRYYENNKNLFLTSPLFEVSHILFLAPPEDEKVRTEAKCQAALVLRQIWQEPVLFEVLAREHSSCSSASQGGWLGQISRGQTMPSFEKALLGMRQGEISAEPVETEVGFHIIRVHRRAEGMQLPYEKVAEWISGDLYEKRWHHAFHQYIQFLASRCKVNGFPL